MTLRMIRDGSATKTGARPTRPLWTVIAQGLLAALYVALALVVLARLGALSQKIAEKTVAEDLARTRYETEIDLLKDIKKGLDYNRALYEDDVRTGLRTKGAP